jgi:hypothetical protein
LISGTIGINRAILADFPSMVGWTGSRKQDRQPWRQQTRFEAWLIAEIKTAWPTLPVILATGFAELPPGTDPSQVTLAKPFLQCDLEQAVEAAISGLRIPRAGRFRSVKAV